MSLLRTNQSTAKYTFTESTMSELGFEIDHLLVAMDSSVEHVSDRPGAITVYQKSVPDPKASIPGTRIIEGYTAIITIDAGPAT